MKKVTLANGTKVWMLSFGQFSLEDIANTLRPVVPTKKVNNFKVFLPWLMVILMAIGLGISGYFNWKQAQSIEDYKAYILKFEQSYIDLRASYDELDGNYRYCRDNNIELGRQVISLKDSLGVYETSIYNLSGYLSNAEDYAWVVKEQSFKMWSDKTYENVGPTEVQLYNLNDEAISTLDQIQKIQNAVDQLLTDIGQ